MVAGPALQWEYGGKSNGMFTVRRRIHQSVCMTSFFIYLGEQESYGNGRGSELVATHRASEAFDGQVFVMMWYLSLLCDMLQPFQHSIPRASHRSDGLLLVLERRQACKKNTIQKVRVSSSSKMRWRWCGGLWEWTLMIVRWSYSCCSYKNPSPWDCSHSFNLAIHVLSRIVSIKAYSIWPYQSVCINEISISCSIYEL